MLNINKNNLKSRKGITLVALVVTVVVLSILAGVSINLVISDDGLIVKSKETNPALNLEMWISNIPIVKIIL